MLTKSTSRSALFAENAELHQRLGDAEEALRAIRGGEVDAFVIETDAGPQVYTLQGQDAEANRMRGEMLAQVSDAVIAVDGEMRITFLNAAAERLYDFAASRSLGQKLSKVYESRWRHPNDEDAFKTALRERGEWRGESVHVRHDGCELNVESAITVMRNPQGEASGLLAVIRDMTERKVQESKILDSEIRYRRLFEAAHDGVLIIDPDTRKIVEANPFMTLLLGYPHDQLVGMELYQIGLLKDQAASQEMIQNLKRTSQVRYDDLPLESQKGQHREVEVVANLYNESGRPVIQCNIRDITDRKRTEEHVKMLIAEVNHRAKNLLAVVQAVAQQSAKHGDAETAAARLCKRIGALSAGQDLLVKNHWLGVDVSDLIEAQLAHFKDLFGTRVLLNGPAAQLRADAAQGIGMALHELATNAAKYGALSNGEGRVHINWQVTADTDPKFLMSWQEDGGPKVAVPVRGGFGQIVIGRLAEAAVQGIAEINYAAAGVSWKLSAPMKAALT